MSKELLVEQDGPVLRVTLNRPEIGNGMSDANAIEFTEVINRAHETADMVLLRSAGEDFCLGRAQASTPGGPVEPYQRRTNNDVIFNAYRAVRNSPVPIIGVVQGRAMGFGMALASLCDVSFASDKATFNAPEMGHNIMPTMVMSSLFDRVNRNAVAWLVYSTDFIDAQRAMMYGIVSTVVPAGQLDKAVDEFMEKMRNTPRPAILGLKEYMRVAPTMDAVGAIDYARSLHALVNSSSEMKKKSRAHH